MQIVPLCCFGLTLFVMAQLSICSCWDFIVGKYTLYRFASAAGLQTSDIVDELSVS